MELLENERIDDLEINNYKIIQNTDGFCFGIDSVLLSDFAKGIKKESKVIDLGTRNRNNSYFIMWQNKFIWGSWNRDTNGSCWNGKKKHYFK